MAKKMTQEEFTPVDLGTGTPGIQASETDNSQTPSIDPGELLRSEPLLLKMFLENQKASLVLMQEHLQARAADAQSRREADILRANYQKTCAERTQEEAYRRYAADLEAGAPKWRVSIPGDEGSTIPVIIPARSREEAWGKYMGLCGVRSTKHEWQAVPVED